MGNYNTRAIKFKQSANDFPLIVSLGEKTPSWRLSRWQEKCTLRFIPPDDEGFTLRGDKRQLVYKGSQRSHRFTILGDGAFEYDCILLKEPESNVVSLLMEGAEQYDFLRQPDFVPDDFLKGSYAVYKKETLIGQGTGKLCHIHRPLIIDARGRKVWGDLSIVGNELRITIPEQWLSEAKYPVIVDPTVGTTTIGSQTTWNSDPPEPWSPLSFECSIPVNRFTISEKIDGLCTAYFYPFWDDWDAGGRPVFYSNNNNQPHLRRSTQENWINLRVNGSNPVGWRSGTFRSSETIPAGSSLWFGLFAEYMWLPRFDYGAVFWEEWWSSTTIPSTYPGYRSQNVANSSYTFKPSMYFTYTSAQNYVRTLTQGVRLTDARSVKAEYKRTATQTARGTDLLKGSVSFVRRCVFNAANTIKLTRTPVFIRNPKDQTGLTDVLKNNRGINKIFSENVRVNETKNHLQTFSRELKQNSGITDNHKHTADYKRETKETVNGTTEPNTIISFFRQCLITAANVTGLSRIPAFFRFVSDEKRTTEGFKHSRELKRNCNDTTISNDDAKRSQGFYRNVADNLKGTDITSYPVVFVRSIQETQGITDTFSKFGNYFRGLYVEAGNIAETVRWGNYYRSETDIVQAEGSVIRQLFIFIKLVSTSIIRDFILRRFLIAREELILKSKVTVELSLESKIN